LANLALVLLVLKRASTRLHLKVLRLRLLAILVLVDLAGRAAALLYQDPACKYYSRQMLIALLFIFAELSVLELSERLQPRSMTDFFPCALWLSWSFFRLGHSRCLGW
jgi:hypothetical protein